MKKLLCALLALCLLLSLCACGGPEGYGVVAVETLKEQDYSIAFRAGDSTVFYVSAAIQVLNAQGAIGELSRKWLGDSGAVEFGSDEKALELTGMPGPRRFMVGVDVESFPFAYKDTNDLIWGYDVELANMVCDMLGWELVIQPIDTANTYVELSSGNIDCAWGGIALDPDMVKQGKYEELGPYIHNDVVIAARAGAGIRNRIQLNGKRMAMSTSNEAMDSLNLDAKLQNRLGQIIRLTGGSVECFQYLFDNKCDLVLTDSTAMLYYNNR